MRDTLFYTGEIIEAFPSANFKVKLVDYDKDVICYLAGKMRLNHIRCLTGDKVEVVLSQDKKLGRIVKRK